MKMTIINTFTATIYVGTDSTYNQRKALSKDEAHLKPALWKGKEFIQEYCDKVGLCVTYNETEFIYSGGREEGLVIGLINYPRFPKDKRFLVATATELATELKILFRQKRVSIVFPDKTVMLGEIDNDH